MRSEQLRMLHSSRSPSAATAAKPPLGSPIMQNVSVEKLRYDRSTGAMATRAVISDVECNSISVWCIYGAVMYSKMLSKTNQHAMHRMGNKAHIHPYFPHIRKYIALRAHIFPFACRLIAWTMDKNMDENGEGERERLNERRTENTMADETSKYQTGVLLHLAFATPQSPQ